MRRFSFRLTPILKLRRTNERAVEAHLRRAESGQRAAKGALERTTAQLASAAQAVRQERRALSGTELSWHGLFRSRLQACRREGAAKLRERDQDVEASREALVSARVSTRQMERLHDLRRDEHFRHERRRESRQLSEAATLSHARRVQARRRSGRRGH